MATRSISIQLDDDLLAALDAVGGSRSSAVAEAIRLWLERRHLEMLRQAYGQLALAGDEDLERAQADAAGMGTEVLQALNG